MNDAITIFYFKITDLWKRFCEEHNDLFNVTCDEYSLLLDSNLEQLEEKLEEKNEVIKRIAALEEIRKELIEEANQIFPDIKLQGVSDLINFLNNSDIEKKEKHLFRFNALLIDIIEKIQAQNKRNQLFINKALLSLKQIRLEVVGKKNFSTYTSKGSSITTST